MNINFNTPSLTKRLAFLWRLRLVLAVVIISGLCAYLVLGINRSLGVGADPATANTSRGLRIDPQLAQQLQALQDNSVSVQALFDEARDNPFSN